MYVSRHHALTDREAIFSLMETYALGAWVCPGQGSLAANHVPFVLDRDRGPFGTLIGHVARATDVWRALNGEAPSIVIFQGPQAYVTPGWYPGKQAHGKVVPTWDYAVVHAHGIAHAVEDAQWKRDMLERLTNGHEARQQAPWRIADAPASYIEQMSRAIVGIEIPIDRLEAKLKASQDEEMADRLGTVAGLAAQAHGAGDAMGGLVRMAIEAETPAKG